MTNDNIVEGDEMFSMSLNVPSSLGPGVVAGSSTSANGTIIDTSGMQPNILCLYIIKKSLNEKTFINVMFSGFGINM